MTQHTLTVLCPDYPVIQSLSSQSFSVGAEVTIGIVYSKNEVFLLLIKK